MRQHALLALQRQRPGTFAVLIAAACLLMLLAAALALSLDAAERTIADMTAERLIVQVVDADPEQRGVLADEAMARLDRTTTVISSHRVSDREARALVAPYIGDVSASDLPLPIMIELRAKDHAEVRRALKSLPNVHVIAAGAELAALARLIGTLRGIALGGALTAAVTTGLIAMLTARAALAREGPTLEILHALGATDRQLSRLVTGKIMRDAAIGTVAGSGIAVLMILLIGARVGALGTGIDPRLGPGGWFILAVLAAALVGVATAAAQGALLATLRRAP
ncbi:MAG TPA: FtsX-like permease family protein [Sphingomonas sp.]|nr:FtsX-like permease family protein [Sphingomonas sp.]